MRFDEHFLQGAVQDALVVQGQFPEEACFSVDTRTLQPGELFVALPGSHTNGHDFIANALEKKAHGLIIHHDQVSKVKSLNLVRPSHLIIATSDTLALLIRLAEAWRAQFSYPVLAVTGSVGKTSTKEMIAHILTEHKMPHLASFGNQNTRIGLSLNMLRMRARHQAAVFEIGINKRGEMAELARMLKPSTALITCVGHSHMEGLGSLADIALEKRDVFKYFTSESIGIINGDQPLLASVGYPYPVIKFGFKTTNQIQARKLSVAGGTLSFILKIYKEKYDMRLPHTHEGAILNMLAATAATHLLGVPHTTIVQALYRPPVVPGRFEQRLLKDDKGILIHDCYNASPESMKVALLAFQRMETSGKKIAVLGDMLELGMNGPFWHRQLGRFLRKVPSLNRLILVGDMVQWTKKIIPVGIDVELVPTWQEATEQLRSSLGSSALVLVKGSRGVGLNNLVTAVTQETSERS